VEHGCYFQRHGKGDHDIWYSPVTNLPITVDSEIKSRQYYKFPLQRRYRQASLLRACPGVFHSGQNFLTFGDVRDLTAS
jgi:hypothetical protein